MTNISDIVYMFYRPYEPISMVKGEQNVRYDVPQSYLVDKRVPTMAMDKYSTKTIPVVPLDTLPDLSFTQSLTDDETFSTFRPESMSIATKLITMFMKAKDQELISLAAYCRDRMNKHLFFYALYVAIIHRPDCKGLNLPLYAEIFPSLYVDSTVINEARKEAMYDDNSEVIVEIPPNFTSTNLEPEHKVAYFREDIAVNLQYFNWHLVYPYTGPQECVQMDRRGERFYYMHQQIMARYNFERLSNGLNKVVSLNNLHEQIPEAYFPKIFSTIYRPYPSRTPNMKLSNVQRKDSYINIEQLDLWRNRLYEAIHTGYAINFKGEKIKLGVPEQGDTTNGIDILGDMVQASILSVNQKYYGNFQNDAHNIFAYIHDPDYRYLEEMGVMGNNATSMRDPIFYRLHEYINDLFYEFKRNIPGYSSDDLGFPNVEIKSVKLLSDNNQPQNLLTTFWQKAEMDVSGGLDFTKPGPVRVRYTRLQHVPFKYTITINNAGGSLRNSTVRIFLAPNYSEHNAQFTVNEQMRLFIELDKFTVSLKPGNNDVVRQSFESSVTSPYDMSPQQNQSQLNADGKECMKYGWPQHMLIPKGLAEGLKCSLFVMVSDGDQDWVEQKAKSTWKKDTSSGVSDDLYPDRRAMGYPFDRPWVNGDDILGKGNTTPNMYVTPVDIFFKNNK